jgi:HTH-type transcriptional regulator/antitoxin HigA
MFSMPPTGSDEAEQLEVLGILLEDYEKKHHAVEAPDPIEAILFAWSKKICSPAI